MTLEFDENGYLIPYSLQETSIEIFEENFAFNAHRRDIFEAYLDFTKVFSNLGIGPFFQWVNGSFVSRKPYPRDIDVVTFFDYNNLPAEENDLKKHLYSSATLDCYFVLLYPVDHLSYNLFRMDMAEWHHFFVTTRRERTTGQSKNKGFFQLKF